MTTTATFTATFTAPCNNEDSCDPGTLHTFPNPDTRILIKAGTYTLVGGMEDITLTTPTTITAADHVIPEAHHALCTLPDGQRIWIDVDDDPATPLTHH